MLDEEIDGVETLKRVSSIGVHGRSVRGRSVRGRSVVGRSVWGCHT